MKMMKRVVRAGSLSLFIYVLENRMVTPHPLLTKIPPEAKCLQLLSQMKPGGVEARIVGYGGSILPSFSDAVALSIDVVKDWCSGGSHNQRVVVIRADAMLQRGKKIDVLIATV